MASSAFGCCTVPGSQQPTPQRSLAPRTLVRHEGGLRQVEGVGHRAAGAGGGGVVVGGRDAVPAGRRAGGGAAVMFLRGRLPAAGESMQARLT